MSVSPFYADLLFPKQKNLSRKERFHQRKRTDGFFLSYLSKHKNVLQDLAPIPYGTVAGRHRASPSATLDKRISLLS